MATLFLYSGERVLLDQEDFESYGKLKWYKTPGGYARRVKRFKDPLSGKWRGHSIALHRLITNAPEGLEVDHINGDKLDNRRTNLRTCTRQQNARNMSLSSRNKTGFKGVNYRPERNRYRAAIGTRPGKQKHLGYFKTASEASEAYRKAELALFGEFARA